MIRPIAGYFAREVLFFQPADAMLQTRSPRQRPGACPVRVAGVGHEAVGVVGLGRMLDLNPGHVRDVGNQPWLGAVGEVTISEKNDRCHVTNGRGDGLDRGVEAIGGRRRGDHGHGAFAVTPGHGLKKIGLFCFGRKARARAAALNVNHYQRQFRHDGQADRLGLEGQPRPAGSGHAQRATETGANGRRHGGDFIFACRWPAATRPSATASLPVILR